MERTKLKTSSLKPTNSDLLDLDGVQRFLNLLRLGGEIGPITIVGDESNSYYIITGRHEAYAALLANAEIEVNILRTDLDVCSCPLGRARNFSTITDLVKDCEMGNESCKELGIEIIADYSRYQPLYTRPAA